MVPNSKLETWDSKRVVVMGLGRFGGGVGVTRYLCGRGADVLVTDAQPSDRLTDSVAQLQPLIDTGQVQLRLGEHNVSDFTTADLIVVNPAVDPRENRFLRAAQAAGVPLTSEIRLLVASLPDRERTIGVTGSAGKSTVTAMIGHALKKLVDPQGAIGGNIWVGGNLGGSLLGEIDRIGSADWVVLELSSFMLEGLDEDQWSPHIAVVTNLAPNHLDRHGSFEGYIAAKQTILEHQSPTDRCILGPPGPGGQEVARQMRPMAPQAFLADDVLIQLAIPGEHNVSNARLAITACAAAGADPQRAADALRDFPGLPHRLELVADHAGVRYINDSKSTTPEAARLALESFPPGCVHIILGGYDKGSDLTELARFAGAHARAIYTVGVTGDTIAAALRNGHRTAHVHPCHTLDRAVAEAVQQVRSGDVLLLSPACASWDQYDNFEQRGAAFTRAVREALRR